MDKRINIWVNGKEVENNIKSIRSAMAHLTNQLNKMEIGSAEYVETSKKIRDLKAIYDEHRESLKMTGDELEKNSTRMKDNVIVAGGLSATIQGVSALYRRFVSATQEYVDAYATLDDAMSAVQKTTGMTREEVEGLHKSLKSIDTRTSTNELLKIAEIGGRMGLAKDQIRDFTEAVNKANVALGDSFQGGAEEISSVLGKISLAYKETRDQDIGKSLTQIGSALNEVGASANATEGNIAAFVQRVGSMPEVFRPTVQQAVALGAAFEESSIDAEVASRAFGIVMMKASTNVDKFAAVMKRPAEEIRDLINTNPAQFFVEFAESLKGLSATDVGGVLKDLKLNADGVNKIIGAMSTSTERFAEILNTSNTAFSEAISLDKEYATVNNNAAAQLEKAKKKMQEAREELGKQLIPILTKLYETISSGAKWMQQHKVLIESIVKTVMVFVGIIGLAKTNIMLYNAKVKITTIATTAFELATISASKAEAGMVVSTGRLSNAMNTLSQKFPAATKAVKGFGIALRAVGFLGAAYGLYKLAEAADEYAQKVQHARLHTDKMDTAYKEFMEHADEYTQRQRNLIQELVDLIHNENAGYSDKIEAINQLKEILPGYNALLSDSGELLWENVDALEAYSKIQDIATQKKALQESINAVKKERDVFIKENGDKIKKFQDKSVKWDYWAHGVDPETLEEVWFGKKIWGKVMQNWHVRNETIQNQYNTEIDNINNNLDHLENDLRQRSIELDKQMQDIIEKQKKKKEQREKEAKDQENREEKEEEDKKLQAKRNSFLKRMKDFDYEAETQTLNDWEKIKAGIIKKYGEMLDESVELYGKNNQYYRRLEEQRAAALSAAADKYLQKTKDFAANFATEIDKMLADTQADSCQPQSRLVTAIAGSDAQWDKAIKKAQENADAIERILNDMDESDPEWNKFAIQLAEMQDQIDDAILKKTQARTAITQKFVEEESKALAKREKEQQRQLALTRKGITEEEKAILQRQWKIEDLNEEYDIEIKLMEAALVAKEKLNDGDEEGIENIRKMIAQLKKLKENVEATVDAAEGGKKKRTGNDLIDLITGNITDPKERFQAVINVMQDFANQAMDIYRQIADVQQQSAELEMQRFSDAQDAKARKLKQQLDDGLISQKYYDAQMEKMEAEKERREKKMKHDQFEKEKQASIVQSVIQGALSVATTIAQWGLPWGLIPAAIAAATAAVQTALIASQPNPYYRGGFIRGRQYAVMGERGPEWVASNALLEDPETAPIIAALEEYQRGNRNALRLVAPTQPAWKNLSQSASQISSTFASNRTPVEHHYYQSAGTDELLKEVKQMNQFLADPKNRQAYISYKIQTEAQKNRDFIKQAARL